MSTISASWQSTRFLSAEIQPDDVSLGDRVAVLVTNKRAIGFDGNTGNFVKTDLGPGERVLANAVGENVGVVVTERRALGLSAFTGGFFSARILVSERLENLSAKANLVTLTLSNRLLIFRAPTGTWQGRSHELRYGDLRERSLG